MERQPKTKQKKEGKNERKSGTNRSTQNPNKRIVEPNRMREICDSSKIGSTCGMRSCGARSSPSHRRWFEERFGFFSIKAFCSLHQTHDSSRSPKKEKKTTRKKTKKESNNFLMHRDRHTNHTLRSNYFSARSVSFRSFSQAEV